MLLLSNRLTVASLIAPLLLSACGSDNFSTNPSDTPSDQKDPSEIAGTGGETENQGSGGGIGNTGGAPGNTGGTAESSGGTGGLVVTIPGSGGTDPNPQKEFPSTGLLDDFEAPILAASWTGNRGAYSQADGALSCTSCYPSLIFGDALPRSQEVYATLEAFSSASSEIDLVLLAQNADCDLIEVAYHPNEQSLVVYSCVATEWKTLAKKSFLVEPGSQLGGRIVGDNLIVYVDGVAVLDADISAFPYMTGRIGVTGVVDGVPNRYADFGGGSFD